MINRHNCKCWSCTDDAQLGIWGAVGLAATATLVYAAIVAVVMGWV